MRTDMIRFSIRAGMGLLLASLLFLPACGEDGVQGPTEPPDAPPPEPEVASVEVLPPKASTLIATSAGFTAVARDASGRAVFGVTFTWSSSNEAVATVDGDGRVTGRGLGSAEITARAGGDSASATVDVIEEDFVSVSASGVHSCGLMSDGTAYCWGRNDAGMLGDGTKHAMSTPVPVAGDLTFARIESGSGVSTCGVTADGRTGCWGFNGQWQLGTATEETCPAPSCGTCDPELFSDGRVSCSTVPIAPEPAVALRRAVSSYRHSCGVDADDQAWCWGFNAGGQAGRQPDSPRWVRSPVQFTAIGFEVVNGGFNHSCGLGTDGTAYCWGSDAFVKGPDGERGPFPAPIGEGLAFDALASGGWHACALTSEGTAYCWGQNDQEQLGAVSTDTCINELPCSLSPGEVQGGHTFASITAGWLHTCALTPEGRAFCWGANDAELGTGKLGDGSNGFRSRTPVEVAGGHRFVSLDAGRFHTCGVTDAGAAYCWGWGEHGQLGNGEIRDSNVPVRVFGN